MSFRGNPCTFCSQRDGWSRQSGPYYEQEWEGDRDSIYGMIGELANADSYDVDDREKPKYRLRVRYSKNQDGGGEQVIDEVRLHANRVEKDLWGSPQFSDVIDVDRKLIKAAIDNPEKYKLTELATFGFATTSAAVLYALLKMNQSHYVVYQPVLERRRVASATFDFSGVTNAAYNNVGSIIAPGSIAGDAALPNPRLFSLPSQTGHVDIDGGTIAEEQITLRFNYGWLKNFPEYSQTAGNKAVVSQQWDFGLWSQNIYGAPV